LLRAYPQAAEIPTGGTGELALHLCCRNYFCTLPILRVVLKANPEALQTPTAGGKLPIHIACERQYMERLAVKRKRQTETDRCADRSNSCSSDNIIRFLVAAFPDSLTYFDNAGELPLHTAIRGYQSVTTIKYLLEVFPQSIEFVDDGGRTALHHAVSAKVPNLDTIKVLLNKEPSAAKIVDGHGRVPLQCALMHHHDHLDLVYTLLRAWPGVITNFVDSNKKKAAKNKRRRSSNSLLGQRKSLSSSDSQMSTRSCSV
jgi:ankyrin repeat protein